MSSSATGMGVEVHNSLACTPGAPVWHHRGRVEECLDCIAHTEAAKARTRLALKGSPEPDGPLPSYSPWERLQAHIEFLEQENDAKTLLVSRLHDALGRMPLLIPTNWCDPLLTGEDAVQPPFNNGSLEQLFLALRARLRDHVSASRILAFATPEPSADPTLEERARIHLGGDTCPHLFVGGPKRSGFACDACTRQLIQDVDRAATRAATLSAALRCEQSGMVNGDYFAAAIRTSAPRPERPTEAS